jgi:hypothetical protein
MRLSPHLEMADVVDLARLIAPGDQAEIRADVSRATDAGRIVDRGHKGESGQLAYAWDRRLVVMMYG